MKDFMKVQYIIDVDSGTMTKIQTDMGSVMPNGYVSVWYNGRNDYMHRVVWEHANGPIPEGMVVDHINGVRSDNRLSNLRLATPSQNAQNRKLSSNNRTGKKGIAYHARAKKWLAYIGVNNKQKYLGSFDSSDAAEHAYLEAAAKYHTHNPSTKEKAPVL
jgi:hypothetical protein